MAATLFNRNSMAQWYARQHTKTDPGVRKIYYLPANAPDHEIRFVEVNSLIGERNSTPLEPIDFGIDTGMATEHRLSVLDVTPNQWKLILQGSLKLPPGWDLQGAIPLPRRPATRRR